MGFLNFQSENEFQKRLQDVKKKLFKNEQIKESNEIISTGESELELSPKLFFSFPEPITVFIGNSIVPLFSEIGHKGENFSDLVQILKKDIQDKYGVLLPFVHIFNEPSLPSNSFEIKIKNCSIFSCEIKINKFLAFKTPYVLKNIDGIDVEIPNLKNDAFWIDEENVDEAKNGGYDVFSPTKFILDNLKKVIEDNLQEFINRQEVADMLTVLRKSHPVLIHEIDNFNIKLSTIQFVLKELVKQKIPINDLPTILEAIIDNSERFDSIDDVIGMVRERIARQICELAKNKDGKLHIIFLENINAEVKIDPIRGRHFIVLPKEKEKKLIEEISSYYNKCLISDIEPVLLVNRSSLCLSISRLLKNYDFYIPIITVNELEQSSKVEVLYTINI